MKKDWGTLEGICVSTAGAEELVDRPTIDPRTGESSLVVQVDATHGLVVNGWKVVFFVAINAHGESRILFIGIIKHENKSLYNWLFGRFKDCFKITPRVIITDGDQCFPIAIETTWGSTPIHLRCVFHIWKNFYAYCSLVRSLEDAVWVGIARGFWWLARCVGCAIRPNLRDLA